MSNLEKFGEIYIHQVRDNSLFLLNEIISGHMKSSEDQYFYSKLEKLSKKEIELIRQLATYLIDNTLHNMLFLFEEYTDWKLIDSENNNLVEQSDGLCGELYTDDGWIKKYSDYPSSL